MSQIFTIRCLTGTTELWSERFGHQSFEQVLLPRFTRDEAIEPCALVFRTYQGPWRAAYADGMRTALEALAAAGVFSDCTHAGSPASSLCALDMADKLDAAGIR